MFDLQTSCVAFFARFADDWHFKRALSRQSMMAAHPSWSAATLKRIRAGQVRVGMTHAMIAWTFGYPPVYGTATMLDRRTAWHYDLAGPIGFSVYFNGDSLRRYDPSGILP